MTRVIESGLFDSWGEVYSSTIPELVTMIRARTNKLRQQLRNDAIHYGNLTAAVYNIVQDKDSKFLHWDDIYGDPTEDRPETAEKKQTPEMIYSIFRAAFPPKGEVNDECR